MVSFHHRYLSEAYTLHEQFRDARVRRRWTIDRVATTLAMSPVYIQAIEEGRWSALPGGIYAREFVVRYARLLGLDRAEVAEIFDERRGAAWASMLERRLDVPEIPRSVAMPWRWFRMIGGVVAFFMIAGYFATNVWTLFIPPALTINIPEAGLVLTNAYFEISGTTEQEAQLTINGMHIPIRQDGRYMHALTLLDGQNTLRIEATRRHGKPHTIERVITVVR